MSRLASQLSFVFCILLISFLTSGGCDISFSSNNDDNGDGGNGGNGNTKTLLSGTLTEIETSTDVEGTIVRVKDADSGVFFEGTVDTNGDFEIQDSFSGFPSELEFRDATNTLLASTTVTIFPRSEIDLGRITITNHQINFEDDIFVDLTGDIDVINCFNDNEGFITVTRDDEDIHVDFDSTTDIQANGDNITCNDLSQGDNVEVRGNLEDPNIKAQMIEVL